MFSPKEDYLIQEEKIPLGDIREYPDQVNACGHDLRYD